MYVATEDMASANASQNPEPPLATKLHPSLMGMPPAVRTRIIEILFLGVTINLAAPVSNTGRPDVTFTQKALLVLAEINKEFQEEVHKYVFDLKRIPITYNDMVPAVASVGRIEKDGLLRLVDELKIQAKDLPYSPTTSTQLGRWLGSPSQISRSYLST
jgi:hypothetical protein